MPEGRAAPRPFWSGTIAFGLVTVPVDLLPANRARPTSLRMVAPDGTPLRRLYWCPREERYVDPAEIVRGYEIEDDEYVVVTDDELDALEPEKSREIDLQRFVPRDSIDPIYFDRAYFLAPSAASSKAYRLLAEAMEAEEMAGIGTFVMRGKEHLVAVIAEDGVLRVETMRFEGEVRSPEDVGLPATEGADPARVRAIGRAIEERSAERMDPAELEDRYAARLEALVARKLERDEDVVVLPGELREEAEEEPSVIDLMAVLKRRLGGGNDRPARTVRANEPGADLEKRTKKELYGLARDLEIEGRSSMSKAELVRAIREGAR